MWLTRVLLGHRYRGPKVPGLQYIGKHRRHRQITPMMIRNTERRLALEADNEKYLSTPFLTQEEEVSHAKERRDKLNEEFRISRRFKNVRPYRYMDDHFAHLRNSRKWES